MVGDVKNTKSSVRIMVLFTLILGLILSFSFGETVFAAKPTYKNPDGNNGNGNKISHIKKSDFTGKGYNEKNGVFKGSREAGYTCWAYGDVPKYLKDYSNKAFNGSINRGRGGRGDEGFIETHPLKQCKSNEKLLEYEVFAGDTYNTSKRKPQFKSKKLILNGWSTLGGYGNHTGANSSTYIVAVEQINGKNTNNANGVHITKAVQNSNSNSITNSLSFGGLSYANNNEYNRFRGYYFGDRVERDGYASWRSPINKQKYNVYGFGKNFRYQGAPFKATIDLEQLFKDETVDKDYKLYIVKRVNDMIVSAEMAIPNDTTKVNYGLGTMRLDGNAVEGRNTIYANNRTGIAKIWNYGDAFKNGYYKRGERLSLVSIEATNGASMYRVRDSNGKTFRHNGVYFTYPNNSEGAILSYKATKTQVNVNHYDVKTVTDINNTVTAKWGNVRTKANLKGTKLKQKSNSQVATKGTGKYIVGKTYRFSRYNEGELYNKSKSENYIPLDSTEVKDKGYLNYKVTKGTNTLNFFYANAKDVVTYKVNYIGKDFKNKEYALYGKNKDNNKEVRGFIDFRALLKGETVTYQNPKNIVTEENGELRLYERINGQPTQTSTVVNSNGVLNIKYQLQPIVTVEYYDRENKRTVKTDKINVKYGQDLDVKPKLEIEIDNKKYYRFEEDDSKFRIPNITEDKKIRVEYMTTAPKKYPDTFEDIGETPFINVGNFSWRLLEDDLQTKFDFTFGSKHADTRNVKVKEYVGKGDIKSQTTPKVTKSEMFRDETISKKPLKDVERKSTNKFNKDTTNKYQAQVSYDYTNIVKHDYKCNLGTETRCFDWGKTGETVYWGDDKKFGNSVVDIKGNTKTAKQSYESNFKLDIKNNYNKKYAKEDLPKEMTIGKGLEKTLKVNHKDLIDDKNTNIKEWKESLKLNSNKVGELDTQGSIEVLEKLDYSNSFKEDLPKLKEDSHYYIGDIDKNIKGQAPKKDFNKKTFSDFKLRYDSKDKTFKLADSFGISKKFGLQVYTKYDSDNAKVKTNLKTELDKLTNKEGISKDVVVDLDYAKHSRYFMPIDDVKYTTKYTFIDKVELKGLGLNEVGVDYDKEFSFKQYLYGNVMDNPVYTEQKDSAKQVKEGNSQTFTQSQLNKIKKNTEKRGKINLFRLAE